MDAFLCVKEYNIDVKDKYWYKYEWKKWNDNIEYFYAILYTVIDRFT